MSEAKFTKGPWVACMYNNDDIQTTFFGVVFGSCYHQIGREEKIWPTPT